MPRIGRVAPGGVIYHVLNRGNGRRQLFLDENDYAAFIKLIAHVKEAVPLRVLAYSLMPNHWHLILWPQNDGDLSNFMLRLTTAHVRRHYITHNDTGGGHLYQGRFKNFPIEEDSHFLTVCRYVEANAMRAKLVRRAEKWKWASLHARENGAHLLDDWPVDRPRDWTELVNRAAPAEDLAAVRTSVARGRPYGSPTWVSKIADRLGLQFTIRPPGRPGKDEAKN